jgi:glycosyltransferase involved in cell wall biosynthesis
MTATCRWCGLVPLYDNGATVAGVVAGLLAHVPHVVVVDDGSTDGGPDSLPARPDITVVRHPRNRGKGAAVRTGLRTARALGFSHVVQVDADAQHDLGDVPRFLALSAAHPDAVLAGERIWDDNAPRSSRFGHRFGMFWYRLETGDHPLRDTQCGFRVYPTDLLDTVPATTNRMAFDVEVLVRGVLAGRPVLGVPTQVRYGAPGAHRSHFRPFADNVRMSWLHARLTVRRWIAAVPGMCRLMDALDRCRAARRAHRPEA